jgi:hypothetical protein
MYFPWGRLEAGLVGPCPMHGRTFSFDAESHKRQVFGENLASHCSATALASMLAA